MPSLVIKKDNKVIKEVVINKPALLLGRGTVGNDLEIPDNLASRRHCEIKKQGTDYIITDMGSSNGTIVNKQTIKPDQLVVLKDNDEIQIGMTTLIFRDPPSMVPPSPGISSSDVVKKVSEMPLEYRLNIKDMQDAGQSLAAAPFTMDLEKKKENKRFFILYQLGKAVSSATTLKEVLDTAMYSIFDFIKTDRGVVMLLDKESGKIVPYLSRTRLQKELKEHITVSSTIVNKVVSDKVSIITTDAMSDTRFSAGMSIAQQSIRSAICVPLWEKEDVLGVIYLDNQMHAHCFTNDDLDLLTAFGNQIAIRIKQDELYTNLKKEALVRGNLERYHSPDIVELIISKGSTDFAAEEREITVLYADIQNFTPLSEKLSPPDIAEMLNEYFETATNAVFEYKGSVNKYIGDAIMAIFGAP
ncbi:MAG: FHA domain-containing protein, partial [Planctomycetota bacterium]|nr:FHA domain-containing protein [Planctomycetota bacterium]